MPATLAPPARHEEADLILERSIQAEIEEGKQNIGTFTKGVEERVEEELEAQTGERIDAIASETHKLVKEYVTDTKDTLGDEHMVGDTASKGAAAWNDKGNGNEVVYDFEAVAAEKKTPYWKRVRKHEETHQLEHAESFDMNELTFRDKPIKVRPALVEWDAITRANQPDSDLTPAYKEHKAQGDELAEFLGSPEPIRKALKSGKMSELQALIDRKLVEETYRKMGINAPDKRRAETLTVLAA